MGSKTLQMKLSVGSLVIGSIRAVVGSGRTCISEAAMPCQPRIELPSMPMPCSKSSSSRRCAGMVRCCQVPGKSRNLRSIIFASFASANLIASLIDVTLLADIFYLFNLLRNTKFETNKLLPVKLVFSGAEPGIAVRIFCGASSLKTARALAQHLRPRLTGADAEGLVDGGHEDLSVSNMPGARGLHNRLNRGVNELVGDHDFDLHLRHKIDDIFSARIHRRLAAASPKSLHLGDR